ncbi:MAG: VOC family protein [Chitinophagaceae bacterium]|nr:VOC family protein [Chitinophagaceae bacterium]
MAKDFWLNLPVRDIKRSKEFFTKLGLKFSSGPGNTEHSAPLVISDKGVVVMLFEEPVFKGFVNSEIGDTKKCEVLLSFDAASKEEVDELAAKAVAAGGTSNHKPYDMQGYMYGCVFSDPDGHRWNVLYMDMSRMSK